MKNVKKEIYNNSFYARISDFSLKSANVIVPLIIDYFHPKSVIDVGCGDGTWLNVFHKHGVDDILGIDGDYVKKEILKIPVKKFLPHDLNLPLFLDRKFDIAISLEVAEHLNTASSEIFVNSITKLSDVVIFSGAVPFQPGDNHINSQWPEFWISLFSKEDYVPINSLKYKTWDHPEVSFFYKQNMLIFVKSLKLCEHKKIKDEYEKYRELPVSLIHPELFLLIAKQVAKLSEMAAEKTFAEIVSQRIKRRVRSLRSFLSKNKKISALC